MQRLLSEINGWAWGLMVIAAMFLFFDLYDRFGRKRPVDPDERD